MIIIYSYKITQALKYISEVYFDEYAKITDDLDEFEKSTHYKIWYSYQEPSLGVDLKLKPHELLLRSNLLSKGIPNFEFETWEQTKLPTKNDVFALGFYLISRLEEYFATEYDKHGRYKFEDSILATQNIRIPWVDVWRDLLHKQIQQTHPQIQFSNKNYKNLVTLDIDHAYLFKGKGTVRNSGSFLKNLAKVNTEYLKAWKEFKSTGKDPFDSYSYLRKKLREFQTPVLFFILCSDYTKPYDTPINFDSIEMQNLLVDLRSLGKVGLHPGYESHADISILKKEKERLQKALPTALNQTRQHFLKFKLPNSYRNLIEVGFKEDYSMGYATTVGYRAGTCRSFYWFDVEKEEKTELKIYPISCMDGTLNEYTKLSSQEAIEIIKELKGYCKDYQGIFISLWHNHSISNRFNWRGWQEVFEESLR